ncbi:MAG: uncharacterized protein KVP18_000935 [Porospora cf. gigantea A]|uniref:uncharacterized protein n=1 Tax=Porospora cf. gigantea A TaxID=2853593 RepID=UPI00355A699B|nr:MAG: hypothetical protein KVP18_000935 [Porospora cf. gigantea A]
MISPALFYEGDDSTFAFKTAWGHGGALLYGVKQEILEPTQNVVVDDMSPMKFYELEGHITPKSKLSEVLSHHSAGHVRYDYIGLRVGL